MSKGSGKISTGKAPKGSLTGDDGGTPVKVSSVESLKNIKDAKTYKEIGEAIGRYHSVLGVRQQEVKLANLSSLGRDVLGVHLTEKGKSSAIYLNKKYFKNAKSQALKDDMKKMYKSGWQTETNKPIAHVVTHELAHATWNSHLNNENAKAASGEIKQLYKEWSADKSKKGYGQYSKTNVNEFFAEATTKAVHGTADKYTERIKKIIKKYNL